VNLRTLPPFRISRRLALMIFLACLVVAVPFGAFATDPPAGATDEAAASVEPTASAPSATDEPVATAEPVATDEPTADPTPDELPTPTDGPVDTEPPAATDQPPATSTPQLPAADGPTYLVMFRSSTTAGERELAVETVGGAVVETMPELALATIRLPSIDALTALRGDGAVVSVERDRTREADALPSDPRVGEQWALERVGWTWVYGSVDPSAQSVVAVLDTGVDASHPDLAGRLLAGDSFVDGVAPDTDANGHGTWMAGIVAAATDNGLGVAGVGWGGVEVLPITVLDADGHGQDSAIIQGVLDAVDRGADVALLAFSNPGYSPALQAAIDYAWAHNVVVVAATGNDGTNAPAFPAGDRGVVGVTATNQSDQLAPSSNSGPAAFMAAPGTDILTTDVGGDYRTVNGTSASAAMVAGAAGLMRAVDPSLNNGAVVARLARNAAPAGAGTGNGRLDLARAMADHSAGSFQPEGVAPNGQGGPFVGPYAAAATKTWTGGGGDANWQTGANWGGTAPVANDDLVFPTSALQLSNTNNFPAGTAFNSITISGANYTLAGNQVALGAGGLSFSTTTATSTVSLPLAFGAARTVDVADSASTLTLSGIVSGAGGPTKTGNGVLVLSGVNTFTGATSVTAGTLEVQNGSALGTTAGTTTVTAGAGVTVTGNGLSVAEPLTLNGTGTSGAGALQNVANNNTWSGALTLASATTVTSSAGTFTLSGTVTTAGFALTVDGAGNTNKSAGAISGTGGLTKAGSGTLTLGVANTYSGATTINTGMVKLSIANGIGNASNVTVGAGTTFDLGGFSDTIGSLAGAGSVTSTAAGSVALTTAANTTTTYSGVISDGSGTVGLTKGGTGVMTLSGANTYTGFTRINAGTLAIASDGALGTAPGAATAGQLTFGGGVLQTTASFTLNSNRGVAMTGTGNFLTDPSTTLSYGGVIAGASNLTKSGTGTLVLSGTSTYTGTTSVSAGVLRVQASAALGASGVGNGSTVTANAAIEVDGSGLNIAEPVTSLNGTGVSAGGAIRNLANNNTWSGNLTLAAASRVNSDAGTLTFTGTVSGAAQTLSVGGAGNTALNGIVGTTTGGLTKDGAGTLTLGAANTYTGATTVSVGTVQLTIANAVGSSSALSVALGATFDLGGFSDTVGSLAGAGSVTSSAVGSLTLSTGGLNSSTTYSGVMSNGSGTVALTKTGTGTLTLSGVNTFTGDVAINGGTISVAADSGLGAAPGAPAATRLTFGGGTLVASASFTLDTNRGVTLNGAGTFSTGAGITLTYGGVVTGSSTLTKVGTGTVVLTGTNTYSGATTVNAGTLRINSDDALGTPPGSATAGHLTFGGGTLQTTATFTLNSNRGVALTGTGTFLTDPSTTLSYTGVIAGGSTLTKSGTGTLVLSGSNSYTNTTSVSAGVMRVQSNTALGASSAATTVTSAAAVEIDGSGLNIAEPITSLNGTGVSAAGALRNLANNNTWSGSIAMGSSSRVNSDGGTFTLATGITGNTFTLTVGGAGNTVVSGVIATTTGGLTKDGNGTVTLSSANTYIGATTVTAGIMLLNTTNAVGASSAVSVAAAGTLDLGGFSDTLGSLAGAGSVTSSATGNVTLTSGGNNTSTTYSGVMSNGSGVISVVKQGTGTLTLSGASTFTGTATINAGTLSVSSDGNLGTAPSSATPGHLTFGGGTLLATANFTLNANRGVALTTTGTISVNNNITLTYGGVVAGANALTKINTGTLVLSGANTYTGVTTITAGTISVPADTGLGQVPASPTPGQLTFGGGTLLATASFTLDPNRGIALTGAGTLNANAGVTLTYGGVVAGASNLTKAGTGTVVLSGTNTYSGITSVSAGSLSVAADTALGTVPGAPVANQLTLSGGNLQATSSFTLSTNRGVTLSGASTITVDPGMTLSYGGVVTGGSNFTKGGTGTLVFSGTNTYTGTTTVSVGVLRLQNAAALGATTAGSSVASGAVIEIDGSSLTFAEPVTSMIGTGVSSGGALRNLANDNTWSAGIVLGAGGARINSDSGTLTLSGGVTGNTRPLTVGGAGNMAVNSVIATTTGSLTKDGNGTLLLGGANTYTGATTVSVGTVQLTVANAIGSSSALTVAVGATFDLGGFSDTVGSVAGAGSVTSSTLGAVTLSNGGLNSSTTFSGVLSDGLGTLSLIKTGTGALTLSGVNTYSGLTTINGGTISIAADSGLGTPPVSPTTGQLTFGGGTLLTTASFTLDSDRGIALTGNGTLSPNAGVTLTYGGVAAGVGNLTKAGTGTVVMSGANTYTGTTTVSAGTLAIAADGALGTPPGSPVANQLSLSGGTLQATGSFALDTNRGVTLTGSSTVSVDPSVTLAYTGVVAGAGNVTKAGTGTLVLSGDNTYSGTTTISAGVVRIQSATAFGTTAGGTSIATGEAVEIDGSGLNVAEPITSIIGTGVGNAGALRNLANDNTWSGAIAMGVGGARVNSDGGTLTLGGGVTGNTRPLTVGGTGATLISSVIATTTGTLTKDGSGTLTLTAPNTFTGPTNLNGGVVSIAADNALGTPPGSPTANQVSFSGGTLATTATFALDANRSVTFNAAGGTFNVAAGTTLTYAGTTSGTTGAMTKTGLGTLDMSAATAAMGAFTLASGTFNAPATNMFDVNGDLSNNSGPLAFVNGGGTASLTGGVSQTVGGSYETDFYGLTINNASGVVLVLDESVSGTLTLTSGNVTTGANTLAIGTSGLVARTSGHVVGNLRKNVATGPTSVTFEVGSPAQYAPVSLVFDNVTGEGDVTATTVGADQPSLASSTIDPSLSANRYWTLTNAGVAFTTFTATVNFGAADLDAGADPTDFTMELYSGSSWQALTTGTHTVTSTSASGIGAFGDLAVGQLSPAALDHFVVAAPGSATAGTAFDTTVTAVDVAGNRIGTYNGTVSFSSTDPHAFFSPSSYTFQPADLGTRTFVGGTTLYRAGLHYLTVTDGPKSGTSGWITVSPNSFAMLQALVPGETADPGSLTGKTGSPDPQVVNSPVTVTVSAVDAYWNVVPATDTVGITSSDALATLPANAPLSAGTVSFTVYFQTGGATTVTATDLTDGSKTASTSATIAVTNQAPVTGSDGYEMVADNTLVVAAPGVLTNDTDPELQPVSVALPRPVNGPSHGSVTLNADGSFTYTPTGGFSGTDTFTYVATDGAASSTETTVTITIRDHSLISNTGWGTSFSGSRYMDFTFPPYVPAGSTVTAATFHFSYRSLDAAGTECYYVEVYQGATFLGSHGSAGSPVSCNGGAGYVTDNISLPEVDTYGEANQLTVRVYMRDSAGAQSQINLATLTVNYSLE